MRVFVTTAAAALGLAAVGTAQPFKPGPKIAPPPFVHDPGRFSDPVLRGAVESDARPAPDRARDRYRHPRESLEFWGVRPGLTVIDLQPGGGYWTWILAPYARATGGRYVAAGAERGRAAFLAKFADPRFGALSYVLFDGRSPPLAPGGADLILTSREIHNWIGDGYTDKAFADAFAALKPGGTLAVEEHRADPTRELPGASNGYVATATVIGAAKRAGFVFEASAEINANAGDTKDYPFGVWTLPPTRQSSPDAKTPAAAGFDRARYDAIGESDRMTLRFRKPG